MLTVSQAVYFNTITVYSNCTYYNEIPSTNHVPAFTDFKFIGKRDFLGKIMILAEYTLDGTLIYTAVPHGVVVWIAIDVAFRSIELRRVLADDETYKNVIEMNNPTTSESESEGDFGIVSRSTKLKHLRQQLPRLACYCDGTEGEKEFAIAQVAV